MKATLPVALILVLFSALSASAQCGGCTPGVKAGFTPGAAMTIYLDPSLSANEYDAATAAIAGWNQWFVQMGYPPPYTTTNNSYAANVTIKEDPSLHNSGIGGATNSSTGTISMNPDYQGRTDGFLSQVASHEFGHSVGFTDVYTSGCQGQTVMFGNITVGGPYTTGPTGVDTCQLSQFNGFGSGGNDSTLNQCDSQWGCAEPMVFNLGNGSYQLTGLENPVFFDIFGAGPRAGRRHIGWTAPASNMAFLAFDRNENGVIDGGGELFGNGTLLRNGQHAATGFDALAQYDENGDGEIDAADPIWQYLQLWIDRNHNGISEADELRPIATSSITAIELSHHWANRSDTSGNYLGYEGHLHEGHKVVPFYDIFFVIGN
jgi:hypothetical protein